MPMTQSSITDELKLLDTEIDQLGTLVYHALEDALTVLENSNEVLAHTIIANDDVIDDLRRTIEEHAVRLLAWQNPLPDQNLRYLMSALIIASDLERVGDGAAGIAKMFLDMSSNRPTNTVSDPLKNAGNLSGVSILQGILDLGREALRVLRGTREAFRQGDALKARYLWQEDDVVDVRYHLVRHDLMTIMAGQTALTVLHNDPDSLLRATYYLWIAHKLERVADHCGNICERITFIIEGQSTIDYTLDE